MQQLIFAAACSLLSVWCVGALLVELTEHCKLQSAMFVWSLIVLSLVKLKTMLGGCKVIKNKICLSVLHIVPASESFLHEKHLKL